MRKLLLLGAMFVAPHLAQATVISENGTARPGTQTYNGYEIFYNFAPITSITGPITSVQLTFTGYAIPTVGRAALITSTNTIETVTVTPAVNLGNSDVPGSANPLPLYTSGLAEGAPETLPYDNSDNISYGATPDPLTISASAGSGFPVDVFALPSVEEVTIFTDFRTLTHTGSPDPYFPSENNNLTTGYGTLTLTVTYVPIPEPCSFALLGAGLLSLSAWKRRV